MIQEIIRSLAYSVAGLVVGWFLGTAYCQRKVAKMSERAHVPHWADHRVLGITMIVLAIITTTLSATASFEQQQQSRCFQKYNAEFVRAYTARAAAADKDRSALNNLIVSLNNPSPEVRVQLFQNYIDSIRKTDIERQRNPIPNPPNPSQYCE